MTFVTAGQYGIHLKLCYDFTADSGISYKDGDVCTSRHSLVTH